jgi:hypothetical protein
MENLDELHRQAENACLIHVSNCTVAMVNSIRTVGFDPISQRPGDGEEVGTGCAGRWGQHHCVVTANHVIETASKPSDVRIFWRDSSGIERIAESDLKPRDIANAIAVRDPNATIHRCSWEDLALIVIDQSEAGRHTEFADLAKDWIDPAEGEVIRCVGFPIDKHVLVGRRMVGNKEELDIAIRPTLFSGKVFHKPNFATRDYNPKNHYLVPYRHVKRPEGFSGAATWWESDQPQQIWKPNFKFAGICTSAYKDGTIERIVKASAVRRFLGEVFGPADERH